MSSTPDPPFPAPPDDDSVRFAPPEEELSDAPLSPDAFPWAAEVGRQQVGKLTELVIEENLRNTRIALIVAGLAILVGVLFAYQNLEPVVVDTVNRHFYPLVANGQRIAPADVQEFVESTRRTLYILLGIQVALGLVFLSLALAVRRFPVGSPIVGLALFLLLTTANVWLSGNPWSLLEGLLVKAIVVVGLVTGVITGMSIKRRRERVAELAAEPAAPTGSGNIQDLLEHVQQQPRFPQRGRRDSDRAIISRIRLVLVTVGLFTALASLFTFGAGLLPKQLLDSELGQLSLAVACFVGFAIGPAFIIFAVVVPSHPKSITITALTMYGLLAAPLLLSGQIVLMIGHVLSFLLLFVSVRDGNELMRRQINAEHGEPPGPE